MFFRINYLAEGIDGAFQAVYGGIAELNRSTYYVDSANV